MKIKIVKQTFVKGQLAKAGDVIDASENDGNLLIGMGKAIASAEDVKKPENKAVKKKSIFSRKKKYFANRSFFAMILPIYLVLLIS